MATYRDASGRQVDDTDSDLPSDLQPESNQLGLLVFPEAEIGGDLLLKYATDDDRPLIVETAKVPLSSD